MVLSQMGENMKRNLPNRGQNCVGRIVSEEVYRLNVQRSLIAIRSLWGTMLVSCGLRTNRCQPRFHTMKRSLPGLIVQRSRVLVPMFCDSVSYWMKLDSTRFGLQA